MKVYGSVPSGSAEDAPLLKRNTSKSSSSSHHSSSSNFKRIAAATLLAGGAFAAVASKNTSSSSSFWKSSSSVRGLGDALDDAKAGTFYVLCPFFSLHEDLSLSFFLSPLLLGKERSKRETFLLPVESSHRADDQKNTAQRHSKREATSVLSLDALRSSNASFFRRPRFCVVVRGARRREIQFSGGVSLVL